MESLIRDRLVREEGKEQQNIPEEAQLMFEAYKVWFSIRQLVCLVIKLK